MRHALVLTAALALAAACTSSRAPEARDFGRGVGSGGGPPPKQMPLAADGGATVAEGDVCAPDEVGTTEVTAGHLER